MAHNNDNLYNFKRGCKTCCVTVSMQDYMWIKQNHYSLSRVLRRAISDLMNNKSSETIQELAVKVERLANIIQQQANFINEKGLADQFGHWQDKDNEAKLKHKAPSTPEEGEAEKEADEVLNTQLNKQEVKK